MLSIDQLSAHLDRLANWDSGPFPVVSLYLNLQPDDRGRDRFAPFLRKELDERIASYGARGPEHDSLMKDAEKIRAYAENVDPSANGLALFASSGADLFEAMPLAAPIPEHRLYISNEPHLYPLARLIDEYPRYAVLLADTHSARIFVFAVNAVERQTAIESPKTKHHKKGGWAQARYRRHAENYHVHHAKEIVDALARIVRDEKIASVIIAGDEVIVPLLKEHLPKDIADRVVDEMKLDIRTSERDVFETTMTKMRESDAQSDRERVDALLDAYRGNGLGVVGTDAVRQALAMGQVDELLISGRPETVRPGNGSAAADEKRDERAADEKAADELVVKARQTAAKITFIEDPSLLAEVGGVGALLRFKL
jgi:peptide subunit release factor 1 (eRF1)